jgi:long-chain acyl-CoA synthetase
VNLARALVVAAATFGDRTALVQDGARTSFVDLERFSARFASMLAGHEVGAGDRVGVLLPNVPAFIGAYYGALRIGAIAVPLNVLLRPREIEQRLGDAEAGVLVAPLDRHDELSGLAGELGVRLLDPVEADTADPLDGIVDRADDDAAVLMYTSGTTAGAKGAELTHGGLRFTGETLAFPLLDLTPDDVIFGSAPFSHILGQAGVMNPAILSGASIALVPRFDPEVALRQMVETGTTVFLAVPPMCVALLRAADAATVLPTLKVAHVGGAPLAPETFREFRERFGCQVLEGYGMTETAGVGVTHCFGQRCKAGTVGTPVDRVGLRIVDPDARDVPQGEVGEVLLHTPGLMRGYWRNPEATAEAVDPEGWFATGDMGYVDEDGYLVLVDRKKDVILRGGYTVYPREVEDALYEHPALREAIVVGVPDDRLGEEVVALVVPRAGLRPDPEAIKAFVRERVAAYKYPRLVVVLDELPRGPSGKILKREVDRAPLRRALDAQTAARAD